MSTPTPPPVIDHEMVKRTLLMYRFTSTVILWALMFCILNTPESQLLLTVIALPYLIYVAYKMLIVELRSMVCG